jgi:hypothetical protein
MATHLTVQNPETCVIDQDGHALLKEALTHWADATVFTDERVAQVKQRVFQCWVIETAWTKLQFDCEISLVSEPNGPLL